MATEHPSTDRVEPTTATGDHNGGWMFPVLLAVVVGVGVWMARSARQPGDASNAAGESGWLPSPQPQGNTVTLEIDFGNGAKKHFLALPWRDEMTVVEVMKEARQFRPGIRFTQVGTGAGGFLTSLDGLTGEGAGGRNWRLEVDGRKAEVSFCLKKVLPGSRVLWSFARDD